MNKTCQLLPVLFAEMFTKPTYHQFKKLQKWTNFLWPSRFNSFHAKCDSTQCSFEDKPKDFKPKSSFYPLSLSLTHIISDRSKVLQVCFVPSERNHDIWTRLFLKFWNPTLRPNKTVLKHGKNHFDIIHSEFKWMDLWSNWTEFWTLFSIISIFSKPL